MDIFNVYDGKVERCLLERVGDALRSDGLVVFPTETVYGLGANALSANAVKKIFIAKQRPFDNPLIVHVSQYEMLETLVKGIKPEEKKLIDAFWPGPLTIIFDKATKVPFEVTGGTTSVAVRMPSNIVAQQIISFTNLPIAAPSANVSGRPSGTKVSDFANELARYVDVFIDAGISDIGVESTVVKVNGDIPIILRPGKITPEDIESVIGSVLLDELVFAEAKNEGVVLSPGMKYKHYAPDCECLLIESMDNRAKVAKIKDIARNAYPDIVVIICASENKTLYEGLKNAKVLCMGSSQDYNEISKNIFSLLRKTEKYSPQMVLIESVERTGLGIALMNRLIRACGYKIIHC